jgi:hypothetical protein
MFPTHVDMDIFSSFGMWNSCPEFVHTFQLHPGDRLYLLALCSSSNSCTCPILGSRSVSSSCLVLREICGNSVRKFQGLQHLNMVGWGGLRALITWTAFLVGAETPDRITHARQAKGYESYKAFWLGVGCKYNNLALVNIR